MTSARTTSPRRVEATREARAELLQPDSLTALMRATWTWDDRALRRDLADLLVAARASELLQVAEWADASWRDWHEAGTATLASTFVRRVLGSHLLTQDLPGIEAYTNVAREVDVDMDSERDGGRVVEAFLAASGPRARVADSTTLGAAAAAAYSAALNGPNGAGRGLADTALARATLDAVAGDSSAAALGDLIAQGHHATLAVAERLGTWDSALVRTRAERADDDTVCLTGEKRVVPYVDGCENILVLGRTVAGPTLYCVDAQANGISVVTSARTNPDTPFSTLRLDHVTATQIGVEGTGGRLMARVLETAAVIIAGEQIGHAERSIETLYKSDPANAALPYLVSAWAAAAAVWQAAVDVTAAGDDNGVAAGMTHIAAGRAARSATSQALAAVGAGGDAHTRRDRADALDLLFGGPAASHERLLERMDI